MPDASRNPRRRTTEPAKRLSRFSRALLKAYQDYTNRLQEDRDSGGVGGDDAGGGDDIGTGDEGGGRGRSNGSASDEQHFHRYLSSVCDLLATHVGAESCSVMLRGAVELKEFPKGYLRLVACNKSSVWKRKLREKPRFDLARKSITKTIYQSRSVEVHDFLTIRHERRDPIGQFDLKVWTGSELKRCFRNYIGMPIRIQPQAEPVGVLRVENKLVKPAVHDRWKNHLARGCEFHKGMSQQQQIDALENRNRKLKTLGASIQGWSKDDASLLAIAASYIAKVEELRLTMQAAQLNPPVPLDSSDFAYLHVCNDRFAKSVSVCLRDSQDCQQALDFHIQQLVSVVRKRALKHQDMLLVRELDAHRYVSRVKAVRSLFERLSAQKRALHMARRILFVAECGAALNQEMDGKAEVWRGPLRPVLKWLRKLRKDELDELANSLSRRARYSPRADWAIWRDADFTTAPLEIHRNSVTRAFRALLQSMKTTLVNARVEHPHEKTFAAYLNDHDNFDKLTPDFLVAHAKPLARLLLGHHSRRARRQASYLVQLYGLAQDSGWKTYYETGSKTIDALARVFQEEKRLLPQEDLRALEELFQRATHDELKDKFKKHASSMEASVYSLVGSYAATYKRARHLVTMGSVQRTIDELLRDVRRRDVLGCRLVCWFESTREELAAEVLDHDIVNDDGGGDWAVERLKPVRNKGLIATHIGILLRQPGDRSKDFVKFGKNLHTLGRTYFGASWSLKHQVARHRRDIDRSEEIEFLVELMDGTREYGKPEGGDSWYDFYMRLVPAEVQIRTALLDTWADQYHDPMYKHGEDSGPKVVDALSRSAQRLGEIENDMKAQYETLERHKRRARVVKSVRARRSGARAPVLSRR